MDHPISDGFIDAEFELYDLDEPDDMQVVTAVVMTARDSHGNVCILYKLIAGEITHTPDIEGTNVRVVTVYFRNDSLYEQITNLCDNKFISRIQESMRPKWNQNCPSFIVTHQIPQYDNDGSIIRVLPIVPAIPKGYTDAVYYDFLHPANNKVGFRVHEPNSPAGVDSIAPGFGSEPKYTHSMDNKKVSTTIFT